MKETITQIDLTAQSVEFPWLPCSCMCADWSSYLVKILLCFKINISKLQMSVLSLSISLQNKLQMIWQFLLWTMMYKVFLTQNSRTVRQIVKTCENTGPTVLYKWLIWNVYFLSFFSLFIFFFCSNWILIQLLTHDQTFLLYDRTCRCGLQNAGNKTQWLSLFNSLLFPLSFPSPVILLSQMDP